MNIVSALSLVLDGHKLRRRSHLAEKGGLGDYRLDRQLYLLSASETKGIVSSETHSVYGRIQERVRAAFLSSEDVLADDWEIVAPAQAHDARSEGGGDAP